MPQLDWLLSLASHQAASIDSILLILCAITGVVALVRAQLRTARSRHEEAEARRRAEIYHRFISNAMGRRTS
jgi:hypothetical protein